MLLQRTRLFAFAITVAEHLDIYATGAGKAPYQLDFNGRWAAWRNLGGQWTSPPGAVCLAGSNTVNVFERGTDNAVWYTTLAGS